MSFKKYWRKYREHPGLQRKPRRWRRAMVLEWYHTDKRAVSNGIVNLAAINT